MSGFLKSLIICRNLNATNVGLNDYQALLENPDIPKLWVSILDDRKMLFRDYGILAQDLVELGAVAAKAESGGVSAEKRGRTMVSLQAKLVGEYCDKGKEQTGSWEAELSVSNAVNDVHSTTMAPARLEELAATNFNIPADASILVGVAGAM
ncbi:hypothetical protein BD779DRAFT_1674886 [Infundibulicybe gibba]|nr:hypothetical protein BD779DRAFT_1674886 [Infundibulicybe gibba]